MTAVPGSFRRTPAAVGYDKIRGSRTAYGPGPCETVRQVTCFADALLCCVPHDQSDLDLPCQGRRAVMVPAILGLIRANQQLPHARLHDLRHLHATTFSRASRSTLSRLAWATPTRLSPSASTPT